jgi:hypothetical protein
VWRAVVVSETMKLLQFLPPEWRAQYVERPSFVRALRCKHYGWHYEVVFFAFMVPFATTFVLGKITKLFHS